MKKYIIIILIVLLIILSIPKKEMLKDGGTVRYKALIWEYEEVHSMYGNGYREGTVFNLFGINVINDVKYVENK